MRDHMIVKIVVIPDAKKECKSCDKDGLNTTYVRQHIKHCVAVSVQNF